MIDRLEMAKEFVRDRLAERDDVIGVLLCGSVARGEATETSDIDLAFYIREDMGEGTRGLACWQEGVYFEAGVVTTKGLGSLEEVMANPINATHMKDAVILFDPTGFFGRVQAQVRGVFMEPTWLAVRLGFALDVCRASLSKLRESATAWDPVEVCGSVWWLSHAVPAVPLYRAGITPSSTRKLLQLAKVDPGVRDRVIELECSILLNPDDVAILVGTCRSCCGLTDIRVSGGLPQYMIRKAESMTSHGKIAEAVDMLWCALRAGTAVPAEHQEEAHRLQQDWLHGVGWTPRGAIDGKLLLAETLVRDVEALAKAVLPANGPAS